MKFRQINLDFHTSEKLEGIGSKFDKKKFQEALKMGHVDSVNLFAKCHHGWVYYESEVSEMHPHLKFDLLSAQIEAAKEIGIETPIYISVGSDEKTAREHPEWRVHRIDWDEDYFKLPMYHRLCLNTPYLDYVIAQIKEVVKKFNPDGIFLDIVSVVPCACDTCIRDMFRAGLDPSKMYDVIVHNEGVFKNYLKRIKETIDEIKPGLRVYHNGGHIRQGRSDLFMENSHFELESLPTGGWGWDHFPNSARYVANMGREYLGMTGKFHTTWGEFGGFKHPNALRYEVALNAALGAKCSIGDQLAPEGDLDMATYKLIGEAYADIEKKEEWLDDVQLVSDIAYFSMEAANNYIGKPNLGNTLTDTDIGATRALTEEHFQFDVIDKESNFNKYKLIILADGITLIPEIIEKLKKYVAQGGKILASGKSCVENGEFIFDFGAKYIGESDNKPSYIRPLENNPYDTDYVMYTALQNVEVTDGKEYAKAVNSFFNRTREHFTSHQHAPSSRKPSGTGVVVGQDGAYIAWDIFADYAVNGEIIARRVIGDTIRKVIGDEILIKTGLGSMGIVTLLNQQKKNRHILHLLYGVPTKRGEKIEAIEDIYPIYNVNVSVKLDNVKKVYLAPQMTEIPFEKKDGRVSVCVEKVDCHQMVVFE